MARILVVDDETSIRDNIAAILRLEDHLVAQASDGQDAINTLTASEIPPDLILSDYMMPGIDGLGLLAYVRSATETSQIPFVFVSASAEPERLEEFLSKGASAYLTKPFTRDGLLEIVAAHLRPTPTEREEH